MGMVSSVGHGHQLKGEHRALDALDLEVFELDAPQALDLRCDRSAPA